MLTWELNKINTLMVAARTSVYNHDYLHKIKIKRQPYDCR